MAPVKAYIVFGQGPLSHSTIYGSANSMAALLHYPTKPKGYHYWLTPPHLNSVTSDSPFNHYRGSNSASRLGDLIYNLVPLYLDIILHPLIKDVCLCHMPLIDPIHNLLWNSKLICISYRRIPHESYRHR